VFLAFDTSKPCLLLGPFLERLMPRLDRWRNIAISLTIWVLSANACFRQLTTYLSGQSHCAKSSCLNKRPVDVSYTSPRVVIVCEILPRSHRNERTRNIVESLEYQSYWITPSGYIRVSRFDFVRRDFHNFLLSPVSTSETVLQNLEVLWDLRCTRPAA